MKYRVPYYYSKFTCAAADCADTCCGGWQIGIDDDSMQIYLHTSGAFAKRLVEGINFAAKSFRLKNRYCTFLSPEGLCDIYKELGKEKLCKACRRYPRHMEDYGDLREYMLSLSCPEAAHVILGDEFQGASREVVRKKGKRDGGAGSINKDGAPWGDRAWLEDARHTMACIVKDRSIGWEQRLAMVAAYAHDLQRHWDRIRGGGETYEKQTRAMEQAAGAMTGRYLGPSAPARFAGKLKPYENRGVEHLARIAAWMREAEGLEPVLDHWQGKQAAVCTALYHRQDAGQYLRTEKEFAKEALSLEQEWENLVLYFLWTYVLGAIYDGDFYGKVKLALFGYVVIREWCLFRFVRTGHVTREDLAAASYRYSRQVENSDQNLGILEDKFLQSPLFTLKSILIVLCS